MSTGTPSETSLARRRLLHFLLGSPLIAGVSGLSPALVKARPERAIPARPGEALDVFQMEAVARGILDPATYHFVANGADDNKTLQANRKVFDDWQIRVRRLVDVSQVDTSVRLFGQPLETPLILAPVGGQVSLSEQGELATARAASSRRHLMIASAVSNFSIGEIAAAGNGPLWFQLYASPDRALNLHLIAQAEQAGCKVLVLTVDSPTRGNRQGERWFAARDGGRGQKGRGQRLGNYENFPGPPRIGDPALDWEFVDWLHVNTRMKIVLKGIVTREDTALCLRHEVDGIIVSNHGGRQEESNRSTLDSLPEVVAAAGGSLPVMIDGGFRRGTDIFKALAMGAAAVCIGRPYLWGLAAFGAPGVARVLMLLDAELKRIMQLAGTPSIKAIQPEFLQQTKLR